MKAPRYTVRVRRGIDKIIELHEEAIVEHADEGLPAKERDDVRAAIDWLRSKGEHSAP